MYKKWMNMHDWLSNKIKCRPKYYAYFIFNTNRTLAEDEFVIWVKLGFLEDHFVSKTEWEQSF